MTLLDLQSLARCDEIRTRLDEISDELNDLYIWIAKRRLVLRCKRGTKRLTRYNAITWRLRTRRVRGHIGDLVSVANNMDALTHEAHLLEAELTSLLTDGA
jgi:hypothetical protein